MGQQGYQQFTVLSVKLHAYRYHHIYHCRVCFFRELDYSPLILFALS